MSNKVQYITKIEIKGLWGRFDLEWNLNPDVNVLSGGNGSGKSTILKLVYNIVSGINHFDVHPIKRCEITFDNDCKIRYDNLKATEAEPLGDLYPGNVFKGKTIYRVHVDEIQNKVESRKINVFTIDNVDDILNPSFRTYFINTFDIPLKQAEAIAKLSDDLVKTELDYQIYHLQKDYVDFQLNVGKRIIEVLKTTASPNDAQPIIEEVYGRSNRFLAIIDDLFLDTGKKIKRDKNEITFLLGDEELSAYQLSSGEKQMLIILLTVLVQDDQPAILLMDEPEISLHFDWQNKLIGYIRELNPNVQVILATHSPAVIMEGWLDKVFQVKDLITNKASE